MKRIIQLTVILAFLAAPAFASWTLTNDQQTFDGSFATSVSTSAFSNPLTAGSIIIATCRFDYTFMVPATVTDTAGNIYTDSGLGVIQAFFTSGGRMEIFIAANTHATSGNVVTCNFSPSSGTSGVEATEFTGGSSSLDGSSSIVFQAAPSCSANAYVFNSLTTTTDGDLIYAINLPEGGSGFSAGTSPVSFTLAGSSVAFVAEYTVQATHGAIAPTEGCSTSSGTWGAFALAFGPTSTPRGRAFIIQ